MKRLLTSICLVAFVLSLRAQGTFEFRALLSEPGGGLSIGDAEGSLRGDLFDITIWLPNPPHALRPTSAAIRTASPPGIQGTLIFDMGEDQYDRAPDAPVGYYFYTLFATLSAEQITELKQGDWYASVLTSQVPSGELRGQITLIPEPGTIALGALAALAAFSLVRYRLIRTTPSCQTREQR